MASVEKGAWYGVFLIVGPMLLCCCGGGGGWSGERLGGGKVQFDDGVPAGGAAGSYSNRSSGIEVSFHAASEEGKAHAVYRVEGTDLEISAIVDDPETASLVIGDITIDGFGALSVEEAAKLQELASGDLWQAIQLVPLEAGCQSGELDPAVVAALVFPWQMVLKYLVTDSESEIREIAAQSRCEYFFSHQGDQDGSKAAAKHLLLGYEAPFPVVYGYFPFDDVGAAEDLEIRELAPKALPPTPTRSSIGPNNALCRGACGIDCTSTNCNMRSAWYCVTENRLNTGKKQQWTIHDCGIAAGCMVHDDCYDECNFIHGASSFRAAICRHGRFSRSCDAEAQSMYGLTQCLRWAAGLGPYDARRDFYYPVEGSDVIDQQECPTEESDVPSPVDVPDVVAMSQADAEHALAAVGLVAEISHSRHDTVPVGVVISQHPASGTSVSTGSKVTVVVSTGQEGQPIGGTFAPHSEGYFTDIQITYNVEGATATAVEDHVAQVQGRRRYTLSRTSGQTSQLRVSGFGSGSTLGGSSQYAGRIVVKVWAGSERKEETYPVQLNSNPPYAFDVSVPIPAVEGASLGFDIEAGMSWPNGHFSIKVTGQ